MGFLARSGVERFTLEEFDGSPYWFEIKAGRSQADKLEFDQAAGRVTFGEGNARALDLQLMKSRLVLFRSIVAWNLDDDEGRVLPLTNETYRNLESGVADFIADKMVEYYDRRRERAGIDGEPGKNASGPSTGPLVLEGESRPVSS
jgi:hypothetical protein